jgi:hypothetical protein
VPDITVESLGEIAIPGAAEEPAAEKAPQAARGAAARGRRT